MLIELIAMGVVVEEVVILAWRRGVWVGLVGGAEVKKRVKSVSEFD